MEAASLDETNPEDIQLKNSKFSICYIPLINPMVFATLGIAIYDCYYNFEQNVEIHNMCSTYATQFLRQLKTTKIMTHDVSNLNQYR